MNLLKLGEDATTKIKRATWFPYDSGWLRDHATYGEMVADNIYCITFSNEIAMQRPSNKKSNPAPYITYLEEGTSPHDIPNAFGRELPFGIGGRFDGKFHSGSTKHKGFISEKSVKAIIDLIIERYGGELK